MIKGIDFYCGAGGLTRGLLNVGIQVLAGIDIDKRLKATYEKNNEPSRFIGKDARNIDIVALRHELGITDEDKVVYAACTPCQPFSTLNRMKGGDPRKELLIAFAEIVKAAPPDFIVVENVPGLNTAYGRDVYERFLAIITGCGFHDPYAEFLDAQDFGVPQVRKRFIPTRFAPRRCRATLPRERARHGLAGYPEISRSVRWRVINGVQEPSVASLHAAPSGHRPCHTARWRQPERCGRYVDPAEMPSGEADRP